MDDAHIRKLVAEALAGIAPEADLAQVGDTEDLREALDLDSFDFLNFLIALGKSTGREFREADTPKLTTLRGLLAYLAC